MPTDWERIELDYRAGVKSLREIAQGSGVSHVSISKRAKAQGWTRSLKAKIQSKADDLVNKALVNSRVNSVNPVTERETIDANAQAVAFIKLAHRTDIQRTRNITMLLLGELEEQMCRDTKTMLEEVAATLSERAADGYQDGDAQDLLAEIFAKVKSLPTKAKVLKDLGDSLRTLITLERQAFGLDDAEHSPVDALTALLHGIAGKTGSSFAPVADDPDHDEGEE